MVGPILFAIGLVGLLFFTGVLVVSGPPNHQKARTYVSVSTCKITQRDDK